MVAATAGERRAQMTKRVFYSGQLAAELDDAERFALWQELYVGTVCKFDVKRLADRPFATRYEFAVFGRIALVRCHGTVSEFTRTRHQAESESDAMAGGTSVDSIPARYKARPSALALAHHIG
jgi:hypothetical protein